MDGIGGDEVTQPHDTVSPEEAFGTLSEEQLRRLAVEAAQNRGWLVDYHDTNAPTYQSINGIRRKLRSMGVPGRPDLILIRERVVWVELKTNKGRLTEYQKAFRDALVNAGQEYHLIRPRDWQK